MVYKIDDKILFKNHINSHQYLIVKFSKDRDKKGLKRYIKLSGSIDTYEHDVKVLIDKGFITGKRSEFSTFDLVPTNKLLANFIGSHDKMFDEFYNTFPQKVVRPSGRVEYLRTDKYNSKNTYIKTIRADINEHKNIMACLRAEIEQRQKSNEMQYFKRMTSWLNSFEWVNFKEFVKDDNLNSENTSYGEGIE